MESKGNLAKAVILVMQEVEGGIEKNTTIGKGDSAYNGVSDKEVKKMIGRAMAKHGLCILPIGINANVKVDRWDEVDPYSKSTPKDKKSKQAILTDVTTQYLLLHTSGESQVVVGYGHGIDAQDKAAGKATTYALKYLLLYLFMVPTGKIDDTDNQHSNEMVTPPVEGHELINAVTTKIGTIPNIRELEVYFNSLPDWQQKNSIIVTATNNRIAQLNNKK